MIEPQISNNIVFALIIQVNCGGIEENITS